MLKNTLLDITSVVLARLTPFNNRTIIIKIDKTESDINAVAAEIKKAFNTRRSFDL